MWRNTSDRYGAVAKILHWLTFVFLFGNAWLGLYMNDLPKGPETDAVYALHRAFGITILLVAVLRLLWRWTNPKPAPPAQLIPHNKMPKPRNNNRLCELHYKARFVKAKSGLRASLLILCGGEGLV